jgi:hypothetical protein
MASEGKEAFLVYHPQGSVSEHAHLHSGLHNNRPFRSGLGLKMKLKVARSEAQIEPQK